MKFKGQMTGIVTRVERSGDLAVSTPPKEQISAFLDSAYVEAGLQEELKGANELDKPKKRIYRAYLVLLTLCIKPEETKFGDVN